MTSSEIYENIRYYRRLIDNSIEERSKLNDDYDELEVLLRRLGSAQSDFISQKSARESKINSLGTRGLSMKLVPKYVSGMKGLLNGREFNRAISGFEQAKTKTKNKMNEVYREIKIVNNKISSYEEKIYYWRNQLQYAEDNAGCNL